MTWVDAETDPLTECYWFAAYAPYGGPTAFHVIAHPTQGAYFADDSIPSELDPIADMAVVGFGTAGTLACPGLTEDDSQENPEEQGSEDSDQESPEEDGPFGDEGPLEGGEGESEEGSDGGPLYPGDEYTEYCVPTPCVAVRVAPGGLLWDPSDGEPQPPSEATFLIPSLRQEIDQLGAVSVRKYFPWRTAADTLTTDLWDNLIAVDDMSDWYELLFPSAQFAASAVAQLESVSMLIAPQHLVVGKVACGGAITDPLYVAADPPQWYIENPFVSGEDLGMSSLYWPTCYDDRELTKLAVVDVGIRNTHEEFAGRIISSPFISRNSGFDYCGEHATAMAGIAAAATWNGVGIAGMCNQCWIYDIETCSSSTDCAAGVCESPSVGTEVQYAIDHYEPEVFLLETGGGAYSNRISIQVVWGAFRRGMISFAPAKNSPTLVEDDSVPGFSGLPFVVGVGGFTQNGRFWGADPDCQYFNDENELQGCQVGKNSVDVLGPACGSVPVPNRSADNAYTTTRGLNSGATAAVAGAFASARMEALQSIAGIQRPDDLLGAILYATRPLEAMEQLPSDYGCESWCTVEDFGRGVFSYHSMITRLQQFASSDRHAHVVRHDGWEYMPETTFSPVDIDLMYDQSSSRAYKLWKLEQRSQVPSYDSRNPPRYYAWANCIESVRGVATTTSLFFQPTDNGSVARSSRVGRMETMAEWDVTACHLVGPDEDGYVTLTGYVVQYMKNENDGNGWVPDGWMHEPESLVMSYTYLTSRTNDISGVDERGGALGNSLPVLTIDGNPAVRLVNLRVVGYASGVRLEVFDAHGRRVWDKVCGVVDGTMSVVWPTVDVSGERVPSGSYWVRGTSSHGDFGSRQVIVLK